MRTALTIAGSDSSGGAGIQADIKTMISNGVYAMSAITALTAQNTTGVTGIMEATPEFLADQLDNIFTDIYPDAVKIGMVSSSAATRRMLMFYLLVFYLPVFSQTESAVCDSESFPDFENFPDSDLFLVSAYFPVQA